MTEPLWPSGHTTAELDGAYLEDWELDRLARLIRMGVSLGPYYRSRLRARRLSWLGIMRAEQTPARMARVLILLDRDEAPATGTAMHGYIVTMPCVRQIGPCDQDGEHTHTYMLTLV